MLNTGFRASVCFQPGAAFNLMAKMGFSLSSKCSVLCPTSLTPWAEQGTLSVPIRNVMSACKFSSAPLPVA